MDTCGHKGGCVQKVENIIGENGHMWTQGRKGGQLQPRRMCPKMRKYYRGKWTHMDTKEEGWTVTTKKDVSKNEKIL